MAGDVHAMFDAVGSALPQIQSGGLRALGVTATAHLRVLPDIPLIGDVVPGYAVTGWLGIGVPKGTPAENVEQLHRAVNVVLADPTVKIRMDELGSEIFTGSSAAAAADWVCKLVSEVSEVSDALISLVFSSDACSDTWDVDTKVSEQVAEPNPLIFRCFGRL